MKKTQTRTPGRSILSGILKKADRVGVRTDGSQTCDVNRLQCARLLFLHRVSAADELAGSARARASKCMAAGLSR